MLSSTQGFSVCRLSMPCQARWFCRDHADPLAPLSPGHSLSWAQLIPWPRHQCPLAFQSSRTPAAWVQQASAAQPSGVLQHQGQNRASSGMQTDKPGGLQGF